MKYMTLIILTLGSVLWGLLQGSKLRCPELNISPLTSTSQAVNKVGASDAPIPFQELTQSPVFDPHRGAPPNEQASTPENKAPLAPVKLSLIGIVLINQPMAMIKHNEQVLTCRQGDKIEGTDFRLTVISKNSVTLESPSRPQLVLEIDFKKSKNLQPEDRK